MKRVYTDPFQEYISKKIILITGPRQVGKTTITKMFQGKYSYLNFDESQDRQILREKSWDRGKDLIIFDEIHKMKNWKQWLKGIYDTEGLNPKVVVTGSARLDTYKKVGDSLAGRYFRYRVHPLDIRELTQLKFKLSRQKILERLLLVGGFPEPFLENSTKFYNLWKKTHTDIILRQDLISLEAVRDIQSIEILIDLLRERVGSPVSYSSLAEDLQVSDKTVKRWLTALENMYIIFKITPFHKNIARSNLKQPKFYFYDIAQVADKGGARLENLVACALLKECHLRQDTLGEDWSLHYLSKKGGKEIDFLVTHEQSPQIAIEVKSSDNKPSKSFDLFSSDLPSIKKIQLVKNLKTEKTFPDGLEIRRPENWLMNW